MHLKCLPRYEIPDSWTLCFFALFKCTHALILLKTGKTVFCSSLSRSVKSFLGHLPGFKCNSKCPLSFSASRIIIIHQRERKAVNFLTCLSLSLSLPRSLGFKKAREKKKPHLPSKNKVPLLIVVGGAAHILGPI